MLNTTRTLLPRPRHPFFVGREKAVRELHERLQSGQWTIIHGPGGIGKTTLALEYAHSFSAHYPLIFWLNAATRALLLADCHELARFLHLPLEETPTRSQEEERSAEQTEPESQRKQTSTLPLPDWLASTSKYLLVLDDLHDPALLQEIFPQSLTGHVLITTRASKLDLQQPTQWVELSPLDTQSATQFLLSLAGLTSSGEAPPEHMTEACALARELRGQPLALTLAGIKSATTGSSFSRTLLEYRASLNQLPVCQDLQDGLSRELAAIMALSLASLKQIHPLATEMLEDCAFLAPFAIPARLFRPECCESTTTSSVQQRPEQNLALDLLIAHGFLTCGNSQQVVSIHPLLQQAVHYLLSPEQQCQRVTHALHQLFQLIPVCQANTVWRLRLSAHIYQCAVLSEPYTFTSAEVAKTFAWAASALEKQGILLEATLLLRKAIAVWEQVPGIKPLALILQRRKLLRLFERQGNYSEAVNVLQQIITAYTRIPGGTHPEVLYHLIHLARAYMALHCKEEAEACYQKALTLSKRESNRAASLVLAIQYELAMFYVRANEFSDAEILLQKIYTTFKKKLGSDHPETLKRALELAVARMMLHKWGGAEALFQRVSISYAHDSAIPASEIIRILHYLALTQVAQARWDAAETTYQSILDRFVATYERLHPALLRYLMEMFSMYQAQKRSDKQEAKQAILEWIQQIREEQVIHPQETAPLAILENLNALGGIYLGQRKFVEAEHMFLRSLLFSEHLELRDPVTLAINLTALALTQAAQGETRSQQANLFLQAALSIWKHLLGANSPKIAALQTSYQQWLSSNSTKGNSYS